MSAKFAREYHSRERVEWVSRLPCVACGQGPCENHHVWGEGMGRKGPYTAIVPLCFGCHRRYHTIGKLSMLQAVGPLRMYVTGYYGREEWRTMDSWEEAAEHVERLWQQHMEAA